MGAGRQTYPIAGNMVPSAQQDDILTLAAIGSMSACLASVMHQAIGHGLPCLIAGYEITLLASTTSNCSVMTPLSAAGGPLANLVCGIISLTFARYFAKNSTSRFFATVFGIFSLSWFSMQNIRSAIMVTDDLAWLANHYLWPEQWRPIALLAALLASLVILVVYVPFFRRLIVADELPNKLPVRFGAAYAAAAVVFSVAGLLWQKNPYASAWVNFLAIGAAPAPAWLSLLVARRYGPVSGPSAPVGRSIRWIVVGIVVTLLFAMFQARGFGRLA